MSAAVIDCLHDIEIRVDCVAKMLSGVPGDDLVRVCADLQQAVNRFHTLLQQSPQMLFTQPHLLLQVDKAAAALVSVQENLARRAALTQQTLQTLLPTVRSDTYGVGTFARMRQPYGSAGQRSGEFQVVAA